MALSPEDESVYNMQAIKMQRDVNCLTDPDRSVRRRAAYRINCMLQSELSHVSNSVVRALSDLNLKRVLLQCAESDAVEKCRELALTSLRILCERGALEPSVATLKEVVTLANARLGQLPYPEPTEEIRLLILQLLHIFLTQLAAVKTTLTSLRDVITELANVLGKSAADLFPDAKKVSADCVILISKTWKCDIGMQIGTIVKPLVINVGHQHSRVRVCALQALEAAVPCGSEALPELMNEVLMPAVSKVIFDHAPSVRMQLVRTLAAWLSQNEHIQQFEASVFSVFLAGIVDDSPKIRALSIAELGLISTNWETRCEDIGIKFDDVEPMSLSLDTENCIPPLYFESRPPLGARKFAASLHAQVLPSLLEKTGDWTVQVRERYTQILSAYIILLEQNINPYIDKVFAALVKICRDDEDVVQISVKACLGVIGYYADPHIVLASLVPIVTGRSAGQDTAQHRINGLTLLGFSLEGMTMKTIDTHLEFITEALCDASLRESELADLHDVLAGVISSIVKTAGPLLAQNDEVCFRLFWVLSHLFASSSESSASYELANESVQNLAAIMEQSVEGLYLRYMGKILDTMTLPIDVSEAWQKNNPYRVLFDSLCRRGGAACREYMARIVPVFLAHLEPDQDADVRLAFLALLETMLGTDSIIQAFKPYSVPLLKQAIISNIVWRGGRVSATIRKVAVASAYTLLRQGIADQSCLFETAPEMLPVLKSSLDDGDAKTRQLVCLALQYLFVALPGCLGEEPVHQLYADILKRLDDSSDTVRKAACQTFTTFLKAAPKEHFEGTIIDYTLDCLFVHLDDTELDIQEAVFAVLKETANIDAPRLAKKAEENRTRHRKPHYCDQLLALATVRSI
ncbi:putative armadillo-like helical protein [Plasmopara halstedii]